MADIEKRLRQYRAGGASRNSETSVGKLVKVVFRFALEQEQISRDVTLRLKLAPMTRRLVAVREETRKQATSVAEDWLYDAQPSKRAVGLVALLALHAGLRRNEAMGVRRSDIDLSADELHIPEFDGEERQAAHHPAQPVPGSSARQRAATG